MMMNKTKIIGRIAATVMAGTMVMTPMTAFAAEENFNLPFEFTEDGEYYEDKAANFPANDGELDLSRGILGNNNGSISTNGGIVITNKGNIATNDGLVVYNRGDVKDNNAFVVNITGTVENNLSEGYVFGRFYDGEAGNSKVVNNLGGTVVTGYHPEDLVTVENNYSGAMGLGFSPVDGKKIDHEGKIVIVNNYAENEYKNKDYVTVEKQYHAVEVTPAENIEVSYDGFTVAGDKQYALVEENAEPVEIGATITLKAQDGFELTDDGQLEGENDKIAYALNKNDDGTYTVKITSLKGDAELTTDDLHIEASEISEASEATETTEDVEAPAAPVKKEHHRKHCHH